MTIKNLVFFKIYVENYMKSLKRHIVPTIIFSKNNATEVHHTGSKNTCSWRIDCLLLFESAPRIITNFVRQIKFKFACHFGNF